MQNEWILDVLADLKSFARSNELTMLAEQLEDTRLIAAAEIASVASKAGVLEHGEQGQPEPDLGGAGIRHLA